MLTKEERGIEAVKRSAWEFNLAGDFDSLAKCIAWLEANWHNDPAAQAFYTELEQFHHQ